MLQIIIMSQGIIQLLSTLGIMIQYLVLLYCWISSCWNFEKNQHLKCGNDRNGSLVSPAVNGDSAQNYVVENIG